MSRFRPIVITESHSKNVDRATVTDQGATVGLCVEGDDTADLLLTPDEARKLACALNSAAFMVEQI